MTGVSAWLTLQQKFKRVSRPRNYGRLGLDGQHLGVGPVLCVAGFQAPSLASRCQENLPLRPGQPKVSPDMANGPWGEGRGPSGGIAEFGSHHRGSEGPPTHRWPAGRECSIPCIRPSGGSQWPCSTRTPAGSRPLASRPTQTETLSVGKAMRMMPVSEQVQSPAAPTALKNQLPLVSKLPWLIGRLTMVHSKEEFCKERPLEMPAGVQGSEPPVSLGSRVT